MSGQLKAHAQGEADDGAVVPITGAAERVAPDFDDLHVLRDDEKGGAEELKLIAAQEEVR